MNPEDKGVTRKVWLHLLMEGGRWTATELADPMQRASTEMANLLKSMHKSGHIARFERDAGKDGRVKFGITSVCKVPVGVTLKDLASASVVELAQ